MSPQPAVAAVRLPSTLAVFNGFLVWLAAVGRLLGVAARGEVAQGADLLVAAVAMGLGAAGLYVVVALWVEGAPARRRGIG